MFARTLKEKQSLNDTEREKAADLLTNLYRQAPPRLIGTCHELRRVAERLSIGTPELHAIVADHAERVSIEMRKISEQFEDNDTIPDDWVEERANQREQCTSWGQQ